MKFDMLKAVFCGLALIAAVIFFGPGSVPAVASNGVQKVQICNADGKLCSLVVNYRRDNALFVRNSNIN